jgi:hypothetical protein
MGCDIHAFIEKKDPHDSSDYSRSIHFPINNDYFLFGLLAGVRSSNCDYIEPRGLPLDINWFTRELYEEMEMDAHTPSWLTLPELEAIIPKLEEGRQADKEKFDGFVSHMEEIFANDISMQTPERRSNFDKILIREKEQPDRFYWFLAVINCMRFAEANGLKTRLVFWFDN